MASTTPGPPHPDGRFGLRGSWYPRSVTTLSLSPVPGAAGAAALGRRAAAALALPVLVAGLVLSTLLYLAVAVGAVLGLVALLG